MKETPKRPDPGPDASAAVLDVVALVAILGVLLAWTLLS
jgi:hypothetical protein